MVKSIFYRDVSGIFSEEDNNSFPTLLDNFDIKNGSFQGEFHLNPESNCNETSSFLTLCSIPSFDFDIFSQGEELIADFSDTLPSSSADAQVISLDDGSELSIFVFRGTSSSVNTTPQGLSLVLTLILEGGLFEVFTEPDFSLVRNFLETSDFEVEDISSFPGGSIDITSGSLVNDIVPGFPGGRVGVPEPSTILGLAVLATSLKFSLANSISKKSKPS